MNYLFLRDKFSQFDNFATFVDLPELWLFTISTVIPVFRCRERGSPYVSLQHTCEIQKFMVANENDGSRGATQVDSLCCLNDFLETNLCERKSNINRKQDYLVENKIIWQIDLLMYV